jgi:hypothetical protein
MPLNLHDPAARAEQVYRQWMQTYVRTANPRHLQTARSCLYVMLERQGRRPTAETIATIRAGVKSALERYALEQMEREPAI